MSKSVCRRSRMPLKINKDLELFSRPHLYSFDNSFNIYRLAKCHYQTVFTVKVIH